MKNTSSVKDDVPVKDDLEHYTVAILFLLRWVQYSKDGDDV